MAAVDLAVAAGSSDLSSGNTVQSSFSRTGLAAVSSKVTQPPESLPMALWVGPPDVPPPSRAVRLLKSWKLWLLGLFAALALIGVSLSIRGYQRYQALRYLDKKQTASGSPHGSETGPKVSAASSQFG
jgi:hypothetical protein